jgi:hypothetical protein
VSPDGGTSPKDAAAQKTVDSIIRQAMDDHLRSLARGDAERVRFDFGPQLGDRVPQLEALVPRGLRSYKVLSDRVDGNTSHVLVQLEGDTTTQLEWVWSNVDGRFRIVDIRQPQDPV